MKASIIIPSYNACERLYYNLISLDIQDYDKSLFEVIVVDNGSTDETNVMLSTIDTSLDLKVIRLENNQGRSRARNQGVLKATGDIIIFSDSDMISENTFVARHIIEHKDVNLVVCGTNWDKIFTFYYNDFKGMQGRNFSEMQMKTRKQNYIKDLKDKQCIIDKESILSGDYKNYIFNQSIKEQSYQKILDIYGNDLKGYNFPWIFFITNNCSASRQDIINSGMFDETYEGWGCEDIDLGFRLYKNKCKFIKSDIKSVHQEHPIIYKEDGINNIYIFTEKYNSLDVLLFYFAKFSAIESNTLNEVADDIRVLEKVPKALFLLNIFSSVLKIVRDRVLKISTRKEKLFIISKNLKYQITTNKHYLEELCKEIEQEYYCSAFLTALKLSIKHVLKITLE